MENNILGVDISKMKFDVALISSTIPEEHQKEKVLHGTFENNNEGFKSLLKWIMANDADDLHVCMEATGGYSEALATFLHECGYRVSMVNPLQTSSYSKSELTRNKTDRKDAAIIARFCRANRPPEFIPPSDDDRKLKALMKRMEDLEKILKQEKNRLKAPLLDFEVEESVKMIIKQLEVEISKIRKRIREHIKTSDSLKRDVELLVSIPGIGEKTAYTILSIIGNIARFDNVHQFCAWTGVVPSNRESGSSVRGRPGMSRKGNPSIRRAIYMPAIVAMHHNPDVIKFKVGLRARGKKGKTLVVAAMHKLLKIVYGVLKHQKMYRARSCSQLA